MDKQKNILEGLRGVHEGLEYHRDEFKKRINDTKRGADSLLKEMRDNDLSKEDIAKLEGYISKLDEIEKFLNTIKAKE